jgi:hypothetical protein
MSLYAVALGFPMINQPQTIIPYSKHYSWHYALGQIALATQMWKHDSSRQRTCFHCSRVQWWLLGHGNPLYEAVIVLTLLPGEIWNYEVSVATLNRWFLPVTRFSTRRSRPVSLCGLPLCRWAIVAPRRCHFTITAFTVGRGNTYSKHVHFEPPHPI